MRYLNLSLNEAEKLTLRDFSYRMHVQALKQIDNEHDIALAAWYNKIVTNSCEVIDFEANIR